jgi:hypothetical protein
MHEVVITGEEEELVFKDRASYRSPKLVHLECLPRDAIGVVVHVIGIEGFIAERVVGLTVEGIGSRLRAHRDNSLTMAIFRAEIVGNDADFLQALCVRHYGGFVIATSHDGKTVELDIVGECATAIYSDGRLLLSRPGAYAERVQ